MDVFAMKTPFPATTLKGINVRPSATRTLCLHHGMMTFVSLTLQTPYSHAHRLGRSCDKLDNATSLLDLLLSLSGYVAGANDNRDIGKAALAEDLGVTVVENVEDGGFIALLREVGITLVGRDERPQLVEIDRGLPEAVLHLVD
jgi:hypothetical protein